MHIAIDAHSVGTGLAGNETYIRNLVEALADVDGVNRYTLYVTKRAAVAALGARWPNFDVRRTLPHTPLVRVPVTFEMELRRRPVDLLHVQFTAPPFAPCPVVATVHDLSFEHLPETFTRRGRAQLRLTVRRTARRAARLIAPSEHTRRDLVETYGVAPSRVCVIPLAAGPHFRPASPEEVARVRAAHGIEGDYLLAVGSIQPRKNLTRLVRAYADLRRRRRHDKLPKLVLVGKRAWLYGETLRAVEAEGVRPHTIFTGYVSELDLPALYTGALCFVYPSFFEGFGLPPLEAMACGAPVVTGDRTSLPEVVGDAALTVDPFDTDALGSAIERVIDDAPLRAALREKGRARAGEFTWRRTAALTLEAYHKAMGGRMRIAILGTRGVPASYGGFETFAEQLSTRLVARGHDVTVYCRAHYVSPRQLEYKGVRLEVLPTIRHKYFDTVVHAFISSLHAAALRRFDAALICNAANAPFAPLLRAAGTPVAINVDGLEHKRKKWNRLGRGYYHLAERLAVWLPNETVTDARVIQDYYLARYQASSTMIAYGAEVERRLDRQAVAQWGVEPNRYVLYVSRLEPENNAAMVIEAFKRVRTPHKLLIVGDAPYAEEYINRLRALARRDRRIIFTGFVFGDAYRALQQNALLYVHATEVGGTHPALLEAMGFGNCVLTLATPENLEAVGDAAIPYADAKELEARLQRVLRDGGVVNAYRRRAQERVRRLYDWEYVVDCYENLFARMAGREEPHRAAPPSDAAAAGEQREGAAAGKV